MPINSTQKTQSPFNGDQFGENVRASVEAIQEMTRQISSSLARIVSSDNFKALIDYFHSLPESIKGTSLYNEAMGLETRVDIQLEDVLWIPHRFDLDSLPIAVDNIDSLAADENYDIHSVEGYIVSIVVDNSIHTREKLVILLAHTEALIYSAMGKARQNWERIRDTSKKYAESKDKYNMDSMEAAYILAITFVIFSSTDNYSRPIDHRLPFRNNILHRGIVDYSDDDVNAAYEYLVECIAILLLISSQKKSGVWKQSIFNINEDI